MFTEWVLALLALLLILAALIAAGVLPIIALVRTRRLVAIERRLERLEAAVRELSTARPPAAASERAEVPGAAVQPRVEPAVAPIALQPAAAPVPAQPVPLQPLAPGVRREGLNWELFIGGTALGWLAVVAIIFAVAFFLKYAFENRWIGPLGRVMIGLAGGIALVVIGWRYFRQGARIFAQMLTAAGLVLLYLATYGSFGFYRLLPQQVAGVFLFILVVEAAALAVRYDALAIALMTLIGGLLTPMLLHAERDQYMELFTYLAVINAGVVLLELCKHWRALGLVAIVGTQMLYWTWYLENYHPEKLVAALGFQGVLFGLFLGYSLMGHVFGPRRAGWPELALMLLCPFSYFVAVYVLLDRDYRAWQGSVALVLSAAYAGLSQLMLTRRLGENRSLFTALAIAVGFLATVVPIQADAVWVALGWAAEGAALWWFGCRIRVGALRGLAAVLAGLAVGRLVSVNTPYGPRELFVPLVNEYGTPALAVVAFLLGSVTLTRRFRARLSGLEWGFVVAAGLVGVVLLWMILSVETHGYFAAQARRRSYEAESWLWAGQLALSVLWASFAAIALAIGLMKRLASLRWTALGLFAITAGKVFLVDMADLRAFYRILAFFVLAVLLAVAARAYQRVALAPADTAQPSGGSS